MKKQAILTIGIPCSGKTTWARDFVITEAAVGRTWCNICRDDFRATIHTERRKQPFAWKTWNWKWESEVTRRQQTAIRVAYDDADCTGIIISDTNLTPSRTQSLIDRLQQYGFDVTEQHFEVSFEEACRRDAARTNGVGYAVIAEMYERWLLNFKRDLLYVPDQTKRKAAIVDVDGTIATMIDRGPFEWDKVGNDVPRAHVVDVVRGLHLQGYHIIFLSGRSARCFKQTQEWLEEHVQCFFSLYMRNADDMRDDRIVKKELFETFVKPWYNVQLVLDDRPKVCRQWQDLGLNVLWTANPYKEF